MGSHAHRWLNIIDLGQRLRAGKSFTVADVMELYGVGHTVAWRYLRDLESEPLYLPLVAEGKPLRWRIMEGA